MRQQHVGETATGLGLGRSQRRCGLGLRLSVRTALEGLDRVGVHHGTWTTRADWGGRQSGGQRGGEEIVAGNDLGVARCPVDPGEMHDCVALLDERVERRGVGEGGAVGDQRLGVPGQQQPTPEVPTEEAVGPGDPDAGRARHAMPPASRQRAMASCISGSCSSSSLVLSTSRRSVLCEW